MTATPEQNKALKAISDYILTTVKLAGTPGKPGGELYAELMPFGCTLEQFERIMGALVSLKMLRKSGQLYFAVSPGARGI